MYIFGNRKGCFQVASFRFEGNRQFQKNMVARVIERGIKKICNILFCLFLVLVNCFMLHNSRIEIFFKGKVHSRAMESNPIGSRKRLISSTTKYLCKTFFRSLKISLVASIEFLQKTHILIHM